MGRCAFALLNYISAPSYDDAVIGGAVQAIDDLREIVLSALLPSSAADSPSGVLRNALEEGAAEEHDVVAFVAQLLTGMTGPICAALCTAAISIKKLALSEDRHDDVSDLVERSLAAEPPFHVAARRAVESFSLFGKPINRGDHVFLILASVTEDESGCPVDKSKRGTGHNAFGRGMHYCIGAPLSRLYLSIAVDLLLRRGVIDRLNTDSVGRDRLRGMTNYSTLPLRDL